MTSLSFSINRKIYIKIYKEMFYLYLLIYNLSYPPPTHITLGDFCLLSVVGLCLSQSRAETLADVHGNDDADDRGCLW